MNVKFLELNNYGVLKCFQFKQITSFWAFIELFGLIRSKQFIQDRNLLWDLNLIYRKTTNLELKLARATKE
jgi:hypothetical protein